jgi:glutathione synthase
MKIGFVVNRITTEWDDYTTTSLAREAHVMGHQVWYMGVADFVASTDGVVGAHMHRAPSRRFRSNHTYLEALRVK